MKIVEIANSVDPDEASHSELAHLHLQCFFCFFFLNFVYFNFVVSYFFMLKGQKANCI